MIMKAIILFMLCLLFYVIGFLKGRAIAMQQVEQAITAIEQYMKELNS